MDVAAFIDITVGIAVIGGTVVVILGMTLAGLLGLSGLDEQAIEEYLREEHKLPRPRTELYDREARDWIAGQRRSS